MANSYQDLSQTTLVVKDTFPPQSLTTTGEGNGILVDELGTNRINARLSCGDATGFTSLAVKMQASEDNTNWDDISGATFTTVTAASGDPEMITFQLPTAESYSASPYKYVRAYATLVGTSIRMAVSLFGCRKFDGADGYRNTPPTIN